MDGIETYREGDHIVRIVTERSVFTKFRRRWNGALALYPEASVYSTHQWLDALWAVYEDQIDGRVMMIDDAEGPCALAPFMGLTYQFGYLSIPSIGPLPAARTDIPMVRDQFTCMDLLSDYTRRSGVQLWHLHHVPARSPMMQLLESEWDAWQKVEHYDVQDFPIVDTTISWQEYLHSKSPEFREECQALQHTLNGIAFDAVRDPAVVVAAMRRIKQRSAVVEAEDLRRDMFTELMIRSVGQSGSLRCVVAYDDRLTMRPAVGFAIGIEFNGTLHVLDAGCDEKYLSRGAGSGCVAELLWGAFDALSVRRFDLSELSGGAEAEKRWASGVDRHISTLILNGGMGIAVVKVGRVLDGFKRAFGLRGLVGKGSQDAAA